jgi:hypothetical protein
MEQKTSNEIRSRPKCDGKKHSLSTTITMEEAQAKLPELIAQLTPGEDMVITPNAHLLYLRRIRLYLLLHFHSIMLY